MTMSPAFCPKTRDMIIEAANELDIPVHEKGTCVTIEGPRFSTKAESLLYRSWGCDLVNMTMAPEAVLAKEAGLCYAAIAIATDYDCWHDSDQNVNASFVVEMFQKNVVKLQNIILKTIEKIAKNDWDDIISRNQVNSLFLFPKINFD